MILEEAEYASFRENEKIKKATLLQLLTGADQRMLILTQVLETPRKPEDREEENLRDSKTPEVFFFIVADFSPL